MIKKKNKKINLISLSLFDYDDCIDFLFFYFLSKFCLIIQLLFTFIVIRRIKWPNMSKSKNKIFQNYLF